jgi:PAS domain-containing protein
MSSTADNTKNPTGGTTILAPPDRKCKEEVVRCFHGVAAHPIVHQLLDAIPEACALLNKEGQVVLANRALTLLFGSDDPITLCGLRLGEILGCTHAFEKNEGCGTTESCSTCGAVIAILNSRKGLNDVQECRILREDSKALDLRVSTKQIFLDGREYTLLIAADIGHEKRFSSRCFSDRFRPREAVADWALTARS